MRKITGQKKPEANSNSKGMVLLLSLGLGAVAFSNLLYFGASLFVPSVV